MIIILAVIGLIIFFPFGSKLWDEVKAAKTESAKVMDERDLANASKYAEAVRMAEIARTGYRNAYK